MSEKLKACVKCGAPLEQPAVGRPRYYCGPPCRQLAAYELKRLNRRLEALETRRSDLRHGPEPDYLNAHQLRYAAKRRVVEIEAVEAEIAEAEGRLRALLEDQGD